MANSAERGETFFTPDSTTTWICKSVSASGRLRRSSCFLNCMMSGEIDGPPSLGKSPEGNKCFNGRTDNCVKNHFYSYLRKSMKTINSLIRSFMRKTTREIKSTIVTKIISIIEMYHQNLNSFPGEVFTASKSTPKKT